MGLDKYIISDNITIAQAVKCLDENGQGILFSCEDDILKGVLSDGDFRRYMLKGGDLNCQVKEIMNYHPVSLSHDSDRDSMEFMREKRITAVPILDQKGRIIRIDLKNGTKVYRNEKLDIPVVIMAGGKGTRLYPYTSILPKPLIPIGEKTITEHIMERFLQFGCGRFHMIVNYKKNLIKTFFQENERNYNLNFVEEEAFMGTGGGLSLLRDEIKETFFMTNCDILIEESYDSILNFHREQKNLVTMVCARKKVVIPYGTVKINEDKSVYAMDEKPELSFLTNTGFYVIEPELFERIPDNTFIHITDIIQNCIDEGIRVGVYEISDDNWMDMGQLEELDSMRTKLGY